MFLAAGVTATFTLASSMHFASGEPMEKKIIQNIEYFTKSGGHPNFAKMRTPFRSTSLSARDDVEVTPILENGPADDKLDYVFIGDGFTQDQQKEFQEAATKAWDEVAKIEPFRSHLGLFNVWAVNAVSPESGVSGDTTEGAVKNTAVGSKFYCVPGAERVMCADPEAVESYARRAPGADAVAVLANSTKYGGAASQVNSSVGYKSIVVISNTDSAGQVLAHEYGHSVGDLADEYDSYNGEASTPYDGPEPTEVNVTKLGETQMADQSQKWYRCIGKESPDGGKIGAYEGGKYQTKGIFRPTEDSLMRSLGREFNLPGLEAMIAGFYRYAKPVPGIPRSEGVCYPDLR
ncbi:secreted protein [Streptomyces noursei ATCC 11455]|nr:secreted protein [Streptomyces noursei ATCC 11455]